MLYKILPKGTRRRRLAKRLAKHLRVLPKHHPDPEYHKWQLKSELNSWNPVPMKGPLISVVVPAYNTPERYLRPMVYSVVNQSYANWEMIIADASNEDDRRRAVKSLEKVDTRIRVVTISNEGIADNTNKAIAEATGEFITFLDHDDALAPQALSELASAIESNNPDVIYSDEDKLSDNGEYRLNPHFKPDWSPDLLRQVNYINHLTAIRASLINKVGGLRPKFDGAQDYDLLLRITEQTEKIHHIPKVLYHWREAKKSTAADFSSKTYVLSAGVRALAEHMSRIGLEGSVQPMRQRPGFYEIRYQSDKKYSTHSFSSSAQKKPAELYRTIEQTLAKSAEVLVISDDTFIKGQPDNWAEQLCAVAAQPGIGIVGPLIIDDDEHIASAGIVEFAGGPAPLFASYDKGDHTYFGDTEWVRNTNRQPTQIFACKHSDLQNWLAVIEPGQCQFAAFFKWLTDQGLRNVTWSFCEAICLSAEDQISGLVGPNYGNPNLTLKNQRFVFNKKIGEKNV